MTDKTLTTNFGPASSRILPIKIREDVTVYIQDLPCDLKPNEAEKICNVIEAYHG